MTIIQKITALKDFAAATLPALLTTASVDNFDSYLDEPPNNSELKQLCFYLDQTTTGETQNFNIIVQAQLYEVMTKTSYTYQEIIEQFLKDIDPSIVEADIRGQIIGDNWPIHENSSSIIIFQVNFETSVDDCNY